MSDKASDNGNQPPQPEAPPIPDEFNVALTVIVVERRSRIAGTAEVTARLSTCVQPGNVDANVLATALQEASNTAQDFAMKLRKARFGL